MSKAEKIRRMTITNALTEQEIADIADTSKRYVKAVVDDLYRRIEQARQAAISMCDHNEFLAREIAHEMKFGK